MKQQLATFIAAKPAPPVWEVRFELEHNPKPGTYVLADLGGVVRTVLFPVAVDSTGFTSIVPADHPATRLLPGVRVDILGPLGNGFDISADRLLLVADVGHMPLLMPLLSMTSSIVVVIEAASRLQLPSPQLFPPNVELILATLDGSAGYLGPLESPAAAPQGYARASTILKELIGWADQVCLALDANRYPDLAELVARSRINPIENFAQALVIMQMPCGAGVCDICRISTQKGEK
ncbi:MAG: hypothetical protein P1S60_16470, partial [Anaerolineae bacterium]|nr:hypothetical protein [Anaerolineae bacterium]